MRPKQGESSGGGEWRAEVRWNFGAGEYTLMDAWTVFLTVVLLRFLVGLWMDVMLVARGGESDGRRG